MTVRYNILLLACCIVAWAFIHSAVGWAVSHWAIPVFTGVAGVLLARTIRGLFPAGFR